MYISYHIYLHIEQMVQDLFEYMNATVCSKRSADNQLLPKWNTVRVKIKMKKDGK